MSAARRSTGRVVLRKVAIAVLLLQRVDAWAAAPRRPSPSLVSRPTRGPNEPTESGCLQASLDEPTSTATDSAGEGDASIRSNRNRRRRERRKERGYRRMPSVPWVACSSTRELKTAVSLYVQEGDVVAEIGSQLREVSQQICEAVGPTGYAVLVDVQRDYPDKDRQPGRTRAMRRDGDLDSDRATFVEIDSFDLWRRALFLADTDSPSSFHVLVLDLTAAAGNDLEMSTVALIRDFVAWNDQQPHARKCRAVLIKSGLLQNLARRIAPAPRLWSAIAPQYLPPGIAPAKGSHASSSHPSIVAAVGVEDYRRTIPHVLRKGDTVVELGAHFGTSTTLLYDAVMGRDRDNQNDGPGEDQHQTPGYCLGLDIGPRIIKGAIQRHPHIPFAVADAWDTAGFIHLLKHARGISSASSAETPSYCDVIYVDVGGLSGSDGLLDALCLLSNLGRAIRPRCIVIKSTCVRRLASSLVSFPELLRQRTDRRQSATDNATTSSPSTAQPVT